jgi:hypothetical protein
LRLEARRCDQFQAEQREHVDAFAMFDRKTFGLRGPTQRSFGPFRRQQIAENFRLPPHSLALAQCSGIIRVEREGGRNGSKAPF